MRIRILREKYCNKCNIVKRSKRSTGVKLLLQSIPTAASLKVIDYGCSNWRNSKYLEQLGAATIRVDAIPQTKPDVVAYPTHLPFRDNAADVVLFTHIFMFLEDKTHWHTTATELKRVARKYVVVETYAVKHPQAIKYTPTEITNLFNNTTKRHIRKDLQALVYKKE